MTASLSKLGIQGRRMSAPIWDMIAATHRPRSEDDIRGVRQRTCSNVNGAESVCMSTPDPTVSPTPWLQRSIQYPQFSQITCTAQRLVRRVDKQESIPMCAATGCLTQKSDDIPKERHCHGLHSHGRHSHGLLFQSAYPTGVFCFWFTVHCAINHWPTWTLIWKRIRPNVV
ncbi:uncharacterized protein EI97DRAFT_443418 [Westerdykella ornata]|uniref:Uncharacterized protein n=1 Tax=Westerdykella ornata TaxID=318751 RepID=A0A6A6JGC5_WESOR|nr:uncharacterized protein EI97DRAFT_443418 [Westerdykella ornata]KAF2275173.1 hypothetical protein EI97DRAFT_443418 [Westerdykella ornata]